MFSRSSHGGPRSSFALLFALLLLATAAAQESKFSPAKRTQIEAPVTKYMATTHVPGLSVAVVENGDYEWDGGFGLADVENNAPASEHTLFRLASISKSLTATAAMQLVERGHLDLDAPVQKYCPAFPQKQSPITTRQVMGHLAGIRHYKSDSRTIPKSATPSTSTTPSRQDWISSRTILWSPILASSSTTRLRATLWSDA